MGAIPAGNPADWFSPDNYPPAALRASRQGRVVVELGIDSSGAVATCVVTVSSGTTVLDEGTCAVAKERGRFDPATDSKGRRIAGRYTLPVRWSLPDAPPPPRNADDLPKRDGFAVEYFFSADGILASCEVIEKPHQPGPDGCRDAKIGERGEIVVRDGKPVPYRVIRRYSQELLIDQ